MVLERHEKIVLLRMLDKGIIGESGYRQIGIVAKSIKWNDLARKYKIKKKFKRSVQHLGSLGLVLGRKKSFRITALTKLGAKIATELKEEIPDNEWKT